MTLDSRMPVPMSAIPRLPARAALAAALLLPAASAAQSPLATLEDGPVIRGYGAVYPVADPDFATPVEGPFRVVFDVAQGAESTDAVNARINTVARYLNMHAQAGVDPARMEVALVLHGSAGKDALTDAGYRERHGTANPNGELLRLLMDAGVKVVLCGQTAIHRGLPARELEPGVEMALSAMTALVALQAEGYGLVAF